MKFLKPEQVDDKLEIGSVIDYGNGRMGLITTLDGIVNNDQIMNREIASGFSAASAFNERGYEGFDTQDWSQLAHRGSAASRTQVSPFNLNFFNDNIDSTVGTGQGWENDPIECIRLAEKFFVTDSLAGRTIELMAQFSIAGMRHQLNDDKVKQFYDQWIYQVDFPSILSQIFLNYYLAGNVVVMKTLSNFKLGPVDPNYKYNIDPSLQSSAASISKKELKALEIIQGKYEEANAAYMADQISVEEMIGLKEEYVNEAKAARKHVWSKSMIPGIYTVLDPKSIKIEGPGDFGLGTIKYKISRELKDAIIAPNPFQKQTILNLPKDFVNQIRQGNDEILMDPNLVSVVSRMKLDYQKLAFPLMTRAFRSLHIKNRLREMDLATINNMITQMIIVKVGSDEKPATVAQMKALADAYVEAVQSKSLTLFWNHTLAIERVEVQIETLNQDKYETWNNDIRDAFGVSPMLLGRVEGSSGGGFMSIKGFMENLEQGRQDVLSQFVYPEYHGIAVAMGFKGYPEVVFDKFKLDDEASAMNVLIQLVQSGILDYQTAVEELGYDWKEILRRNTEQAKLKDDGIIRMVSPFQPVEGVGTNTISGGRPPGSGGGPKSQPNSRPKSKNANPQKKVVK